MKLDKASRRERKRQKRNKMVVDSKSVFVIESEKEKRDKKLRKDRKIKQDFLDSQ